MKQTLTVHLQLLYPLHITLSTCGTHILCKSVQCQAPFLLYITDMQSEYMWTYKSLENCNVFERSKGCIYLTKNSVKTLILWNDYNLNNNFIFKWYMYSCDGKAEFPVLQSSVSHDPSEIILKCWIGAQYFLMFYYLSIFPPLNQRIVETKLSVTVYIRV